MRFLLCMPRSRTTQAMVLSNHFVCVCLLVIGCGGAEERYIVKRDSVVFEMPGELLRPTQIAVEGVDLNNFRKLKDSRFAIDGSHVYFRGSEVYSANPASFRLLEFPYSTDGDLVFCGNTIVNNADPETFVVVRGSNVGTSTSSGHEKLRSMFGDLDDVIEDGRLHWVFYGWAKDADRVFFGPATVEGADSVTFRAKSDRRGYDSKRSFFMSRVE